MNLTETQELIYTITACIILLVVLAVAIYAFVKYMKERYKKETIKLDLEIKLMKTQIQDYEDKKEYRDLCKERMNKNKEKETNE